MALDLLEDARALERVDLAEERREVCTTLPKLGARSTASGDDELRVDSGESATCTVTAGARLAEALRKSRDVNEPEVSSDMALCAAGTQFCGASRVCARRVAQGGI